MSAAYSAGVAQSVEQLFCKQRVGGSIPLAGLLYVSGRYPSGQRGQTVNLLHLCFRGSNPLLPILLRPTII